MKTPQHYIAEALKLQFLDWETTILSSKEWRLLYEKALELQAADLAKEHERELLTQFRNHENTD